MFRSVAVAFDIVILGMIPTMVSVIAQVADGGSDAGQWVQLGGVGAAMSALAYMAKKFADGTIVSFKVADAITAGAHREDVLAEMVEKGNDREDAYRALLLSKGLAK